MISDTIRAAYRSGRFARRKGFRRELRQEMIPYDYEVEKRAWLEGWDCEDRAQGDGSNA